MNGNFITLKKKILTGAIIKSILCGLSSGLVVSSIIALLQKLILDNVNILLCSLVFAGLFLLVGGLHLLFTYPTDEKIAQEIDTQLSLKEKVQTLFAFRKKKGTIYDLQREDTDKSLSGAKIKIFGVKSIVFFAVCITIGIGMIIATASIPKKDTTPVEDVPEVTPFELTETQIQAIEEIISQVQNSEMEEPYKQNVVNALTKLLDDLKIVDTIEARDVVLDEAINTILVEVDNSSSTVEIVDELWKSDTKSTKLLAKLLNYYDWPKIDEWDKYVEKVTLFRESFTYQTPEDESVDEAKRQEETKLILASAGEKIITALSLSKIDKNDILYAMLLKYSSANEYNEEFGTRLYGFQTLSQMIDTLGYKDTQRELDGTFTSFTNEIFNVLSKQKENTDTGEYAITKICTLFGYKIPKFERPTFIESSTGDSNEDDNTQSGNSGTIGDGTQYGSNDLVYDPLTNKYVEYGVILQRYYTLMFGKLENGDYTDEEKLALEKYFDILYGGFDEENKEEAQENTQN